jgi:hypothetical protein
MTDLLRRLSSAGFHIELTGDGDLYVNGDTNKTDLLNEIARNKKDLMAKLEESQQGIGFLCKRMERGRDWLIKTRSRMLKRPPGSAIEQEFTKRLHLWADLDDTLRDVYPMYRGCPVGGCHESAPVRCRSCCEGANT